MPERWWRIRKLGLVCGRYLRLPGSFRRASDFGLAFDRCEKAAPWLDRKSGGKTAALHKQMSLLANTGILLGKELRTEFRSRELLTTTIVFVLIVVVLFSFNLNPTTEESRRFGPGLLWLAFLFAASLMLQPCFLREQNNDTLSALRLSVADPFAIFLSKLCANTLFLLLTELLLLPVFAVLYNVPLLGVVPQLALVFFLGSVGLSVTGTTLSAISAQARMRELLLPVLLLPLLTPLLIASTEATAALLAPEPALRWDWLAILIAFDVVFLTAVWLFGEYLLEE
jgi:heme exporter protein B